MSTETERSSRLLREAGRPDYVHQDKAGDLLALANEEINRLNDIVDQWAGVLIYYHSHPEKQLVDVKVGMADPNERELLERLGGLAQQLIKETSFKAIIGTITSSVPLVAYNEEEEMYYGQLSIFRNFQYQEDLLQVPDQQSSFDQQPPGHALFIRSEAVKQSRFDEVYAELVAFVAEFDQPGLRVIPKILRINDNIYRSININVSGSDSKQVVDTAHQVYLCLAIEGFSPEIGSVVTDYEPNFKPYTNRPGGYSVIPVYYDYLPKKQFRESQGLN